MRASRVWDEPAWSLDYNASRALSALTRVLRRSHSTLTDSDIRVVVVSIHAACGRWMEGVRR
jgi:hypothetical protein